MANKYYESKDLVDRLCNAANAKTRNKTVTFLVGSPLTMPDHAGGHGVPGVTEIVELIRSEFRDGHNEAEFDQCIGSEIENRYQNAFEFLQGRRGQDAANAIVRSAVWKALHSRNWPLQLSKTSPLEATSDVCSALERTCEAWYLPKAVDTFGKLLVTCSDTFGKAVLTTNFDPLVEVSISKHGGQFYRTVLHDDGKLGQTVAEGTHVVHLHGYWHGADTLHTPQQLRQHRPHLKTSLAEVIKKSILVVVGYSGWDDVISSMLMETLSNSTQTPEIMWAFHEKNETKIESLNKRLLTTLAPGIGRGRVSLYRGIDCLMLFSEVLENLKSHYSDKSRHIKASSTTAIVEEDRGAGAQQQIRIQIDIPLPTQQSAESDQPLFVDHWVGRTQELEILASISTPTAFVTGLGGQGKSALAGRFLQEHALEPDGRFEVWDWRDCKEESDRLGTQIVRLIERLSDGTISASQIEVTEIKAVVSILFQVLENQRALLVFDNVDQYVDLETLRPIKGLEILIAEAQARGHNCLLLFTCRPDIRVDESRATRIPLSGLSLKESKELIAACGVHPNEHKLARELFERTNGHPLWIRLIAMQAIRDSSGLRGALNLMKKGGATLPDTTRTIWGTLNEQQRIVLRTMAELDRPETENQLLELIPGINANRVNRALRTLRSFHLVETRPQPNGGLLLGLHPIIREFVRTSFPRKDREQYVGTILEFLDKMISRFRGMLSEDPSYEILEHWVRKAEFQIRFGHYEEATSTIFDIAEPAINRGYKEELIRIASRLFDGVDWAEACSSFRHFDRVFQTTVNCMIEFGHISSNRRLAQYESAIPGKGAQYILLCDLRCYSDWFNGQFDSAIQWGEKGERLKDNSPVDTRFSTRHNLALARRDAGLISEAIESFLEGEALEKIVEPGAKIEDKSAPFYGNIGRCLFYDGRFDEAQACYIKSAQLLEESRSESYRNNKGYIRYWIAELSIHRNEPKLAAALLRAAACTWKCSAPQRAAQAEEKLEALISENSKLSSYRNIEDWKVEAEFRSWLVNHC